MLDVSSLVRPTRLLAALALGLTAASCGSAEHVAPNSINVQRDVHQPKQGLYRHHDIMLQMESQSDVFGLVDAGPRPLAAPQEPEAQQEAEKPAKLVRVESGAREAAQGGEAVPASAALAGMTPAQLWRYRVLPENIRDVELVFDRAGILPKIDAKRPAVFGNDKLEIAPPCHRALRKRVLTRVGADGEIIRTERKPGSVI